VVEECNTGYEVDVNIVKVVVVFVRPFSIIDKNVNLAKVQEIGNIGHVRIGPTEELIEGIMTILRT
jgi:hypothetical protein